jgi:ribonuclease HII
LTIVVTGGVAGASPAEIDEIGIMGGLRLAGMRALAQVAEEGIVPDRVILDGNHDWLTAPEQVGLLAFAGETPATPPVTTMVKADLKCSSVAAASVLAKVERDALVTAAAPDHPAYRWEENKGYAAPAHLDALRAYGPCELHRRSWHLACLEDDGGQVDLVEEPVGEAAPVAEAPVQQAPVLEQVEMIAR